ncbi:hypothetical protein Btru_013701 [Bulinus truncatus]|nr:hypothetical protein Btru_013701 [Bulinus truncatus]
MKKKRMRIFCTRFCCANICRKKVSRRVTQNFTCWGTTSSDLKSMKELRKTSQVTANLPEPDVAINTPTSRRALTKGSKKVVVGETNVHEINLMLKSRLSGALPIDTESIDEKGEALLKCNRTGKDYTSALFSFIPSCE